MKNKLTKISVRTKNGDNPSGDGYDTIVLNDSSPNLARCLAAFGLLADYSEDGQAEAPDLDEFCRVAAEALSSGNPAGATLLAAALAREIEEHGVSRGRAEDTLRFIASSGTPRARWCLEWLSFWPGLEEARSFAESCRSKLEKKGVPTEGPGTDCVYLRSMVTACDGSGSRMALVLASNPVEGLAAVSMTLNDRVGFKDVSVNFGDGESHEELFVKGGHELATADVDLDFVRDLVADSLCRHLDAGTPPPMELFIALPFFGNEPIRPCRRRPDLSAYGLEGLAPTPDLVSDSGFMAEFPLAACLLPESGRVYEYCRMFMPKGGEALSRRRFAEFVAGPMREEMPAVVDRLAANLEVLSLSGKSGSIEAMRLARLWYGLKNNVMPLKDIPFVREFSSMTVEKTVKDIRWLMQRPR